MNLTCTGDGYDQLLADELSCRAMALLVEQHWADQRQLTYAMMGDQTGQSEAEDSCIIGGQKLNTNSSLSSRDSSLSSTGEKVHAGNCN